MHLVQGTSLILGHIDATGSLMKHTSIRITGQLENCSFNFGVRGFGMKQIVRKM
jgi:hypothetical protein